MQSHSRLANAVPAAMTKTVSGVRLAALLSLVMLAAPPSVALAQGVAPAQASEAIATVSVDAQKPWVDTGVDLKAGEALTISANGRWTNGGNPPYFAGPDGFAGVTLPEATLNSASFAALIGKVGDQVFFVGSAYRGTSPAAGRLYLQINDIANANCFADNSGKMDVEVRHPAAVSKTPGMFGINFTAGGYRLAPTDLPGVVPGANWNNVIGASGSGVVLQDNTGTPTTARLTFNSTGAYDAFSAPKTPSAATNVLYQGGVYGDNATREVSITISNIPYAKYDAYVYASQDTTNTKTLSISNGTMTFYYRGNGQMNAGATGLLLTTSTDQANPTVGPAQYQLFRGLTGSSLTLTTGGSINNVLSNNVFGVQLVETAAAP